MKPSEVVREFGDSSEKRLSSCCATAPASSNIGVQQWSAMLSQFPPVHLAPFAKPLSAHVVHGPLFSSETSGVYEQLGVMHVPLRQRSPALLHCPTRLPPEIVPSQQA